MIPIANIYYLLCYAWGHFRADEQIPVGTDDLADVANLVARVLIRGSKGLCRRGLYRSYRAERESLQRIRGRIDFMESISSLAFKSAKVVCEFDELTTDNLQNQILKATIRRLSRKAQLEKKTRSELAHLAHAFYGVSDISLAAADFTRLQIYSQSGVYRLLIRLCKLAYESLLPLQNGNGWTFSDFTRDDVKMAKLFEDFVFSFFSAEQSEFKVKRDTLNWDVYAASELSLQYLPGMRTDVSLRSATRTIVLDAKILSTNAGHLLRQGIDPLGKSVSDVRVSEEL